MLGYVYNVRDLKTSRKKTLDKVNMHVYKTICNKNATEFVPFDNKILKYFSVLLVAFDKYLSIKLANLINVY